MTFGLLKEDSTSVEREVPLTHSIEAVLITNTKGIGNLIEIRTIFGGFTEKKNFSRQGTVHLPNFPSLF